VKKGLSASLIALAVLAALSLSAFGCGGGDEESLTKTEYVRKGNTICGKWQQARGNLFQELNQKIKPPITQAKKEKATLLILEPFETATEELADLPLPAGSEEKAEEVVQAMEDGISQGKANPGTLLSSTLPFEKANKLAEGYGLTECTV
jgi:hypothetical protein